MIEVRGLTKFYGEQATVSDLSFTVRPGIVTVWVPEILSSSCDLGVFVDFAEPVPPQNPDISPWDWRVRRSGGRTLVECPVRPAGVVMVEVLAQDQPQVPFAGDQHPVQALTR
jgi:hypothetical protein